MHYKNIQEWAYGYLKCWHPLKPATDGGIPPNPQQKGKCPHKILISLKHTNAQESNNWVWGCQWRGGTPIQGWCKGSVLTQREPLTTPTTCKASENMQMHRGVWGIWGCVHPWEVYECMGYTNVQGPYKIRGHPDTPKYKKHAYH